MINGTEIAIGQTWKTRDGREVEIIDNDGHSIYPWDLSNGSSATNAGMHWDGTSSRADLITLIQDEHGFIPWNGGECPVGEGVTVEVKFRNGEIPDDLYGQDWKWGEGGSPYDIIAYRVVQQEVKPTKADVEEEPKYTVEQVFEALDKVALIGELQSYMIAVKKTLNKTQDPEYNMYLELKAKFEKE